MNYFDLTYILQWWFVLFLVGIVFLPLTSLILNSFFDKGYIFSKIFGALFITYSIWVLSSLKILPFNTSSLILLSLSFLALNIYLKSKYKLFSTLKKNWKIFLFEELIFLIALTFWSFIRTHEPSIHGLEKFQDFGYVNSILRTEYFPPKDLWLTPFTTNYYYFGHLLTAVLTKISFLKPEITFNLMIATLFSFAFTASFSIGSNLLNFFHHEANTRSFFKIIACGLLAAFLVTLAGNLHTIYAFFQTYSPDKPVPFWTLKPSLNFSEYWYPNATRFIPFTIHEFPLYSLVVADLHGHVLNIPTVLLLIAVIISFYFKKEVNIKYIILMSFLIGINFATNVLDGPIYILLVSLIIFYKYKYAVFKFVPLITILSILFFLPFWINFKPFSSGIGVLCSPDFLVAAKKLGPFLFEENHCARSPLWMLAILYGFFYFLVYGFAVKVNRQLKTTDNLVFILILFSTILIIIPEFLYVKDIYPAHYRANTVFKFGFQAFMVLSLSASYMIFRIYHNFKWKLPIMFFSLLLIPFFSLVAIYPYFAVRSYYAELKTNQGLDGFAYFKNLYPSDYDGILWIRDNIKGQPNELEAVGESYTDYARVSANTGLPTIIGWPVHEWLWRGSPDEGTKRTAEVKSIYEEADLEKTSGLLKKYNITYVFVGTLEKQKYPALQEDKFKNLGQIIFQEGDTKIYKLN